MGMREPERPHPARRRRHLRLAGPRDPRGRHRLHPRGPAPPRDAPRGAALGERHPRPPDRGLNVGAGVLDQRQGAPRPRPSGSSRSTTSGPLDQRAAARCPAATSRSSSSAARCATTRGARGGAPDPRRRRRRAGRDLGPHQARPPGGLAVLLISADLEELVGLSDTIRVILRGCCPVSSTRDVVTREELGAAMTGANGRRRAGTDDDRGRPDEHPHRRPPHPDGDGGAAAGDRRGLRGDA